MIESFGVTSVNDTAYCILVNECAGSNDDYSLVLENGVITSMISCKGVTLDEDTRNTYTELVGDLGYKQFTGKLWIQVV